MTQRKAGFELTRSVLGERRVRQREELIALLLSKGAIGPGELARKVGRYAETVATLAALDRAGGGTGAQNDSLPEIDFEEARDQILERVARRAGAE